MPLLACAGAKAADEEGVTFDFNAYGTLGAVYSSEDQADFVAVISQPDGAGYTDEVALGVDSRIGLQLTAGLTPKLSAVLQVIVEQQYDGSFTPVVEWANVKYDFTPEFSLRAGRIVLPTFFTSDYRKVGYANHWLRPPLEVYNMVPVSNSDGVDALYRLQTESFTNMLQVFAGRRDVKLPSGLWEARKLAGFVETLESGAAQLRLSWQQGELSSRSLNSLFDLFDQFGAQGSALAARYDIDAAPIETLVAGAQYDPGNWFVMAEWVRTSSRSFLGTDRGWLVSGGYRRGNLTPYVTYSRKRGIDDYSRERGLDLRGLPPALQGFGTMLNAQLTDLLHSNDSATLAVGMRWDFAENVSFTLQLDHLDLHEASNASLSNVQSGFATGGNLNLVSAAVSFVY